jgi:hypothetical protein
MRSNFNLKQFLLEQDTKPRGAIESDVSVKQGTEDSKSRKSKHSLDEQIDSLILRYEAKSIREEEDSLMESLSMMSLGYLLREQEEAAAEDPAAADAAVPADTGMDMTATDTSSPTGSEAPAADKPGDQEVPDLNIDAFANRMVRLLNNAERLLDFKTVIVNRAKNFLDENYGDQHVSRFINILDEEFGIEAEEFEEDTKHDDKFAVGAKTGGAG